MTGHDSVPIVAAEVWHLPLPMRWELRLGPITYHTRDYVLLRLTSEDGLCGVAMGYTRETPLLEATVALASDLPALCGSPAQVLQALRGRYATGWGAMARAASLIDIALWDLSARRADQPLPRLLGAGSMEVPVMAVAGYFSDRRDRSEIIDEIARFVDEGVSIIKLIVSGKDVADDLRYVEMVRDRVGPDIEIGIDLHGAYTRASEALPYIRAFQSAGIKFLEDPISSLETSQICAIAGSTDVPIASGEDLVTADSFEVLAAGGVSYLRVDATATGGYTAALAGVSAAERHGASVAPHVWPHIHAPLAAASPRVLSVEIIPEHVRADPITELLYEPMPIVNRRWVSPEEPGLYLPLDWERVRSAASAEVRVGARAAS